MGIVKDYSRRVADAGRIENLQELTEASTATAVLNYGVTTIKNTTDGNDGFILDAPVSGLRKDIIADMDSTGTITVYNNSTTITFFGSTANSIAFSTGSTPKAVGLIGISTSQWAIVSQTTGVTLAGSTVSG